MGALAIGASAWTATRAAAHDTQEAAAQDAYGAVAHVSRERGEAASTAHVHASEIASVPVRTAEDALRLVPGLTLVQHGSEGKGQQFFLRGFDAVHGMDLEVTVDGVPVNEWSNLHAQGYLDLGFVIPEVIQRVDVVKGPFELEQGAFGMAGTARYRLGVADADRGVRASYTAGSTLRQRLLLTYAPHEGNGEQFVAAEVMQDPSYGQRRAARRANLMGRVLLMDSAPRGQLALLLSSYVAEFELPGTLRLDDIAAGRVDFYDAYFQSGEGQSLRGLGALSYALDRAGHRVRASAYGGYRKLSLFDNFTGALVDPVNGDYRDQQHESAFFGANLHWTAPLSEELTLVSGVGVRGDKLAQRERPADGARVPVAPPERCEVDEEVDADACDTASVRRRALSGTQLLAHALLGLAYRPTRALRVEAGARADWVHVNVRDDIEAGNRRRGDAFALSPRAVASFKANRVVRLFAAYGRGLRPPEARAFTDHTPVRQGVSEESAGGGKPRMTQSHAVELGTRLRPIPTLGITVSSFATLINRESVFDHVSGLNLELNGTRRLGAELVGSLALLPWLSVSADATVVDARFRESGRRVPFAPRLTTGVRMVLQHPSGVRAGLRFVGVAPRTLPHGARGQALYMLDATLGYRRGWFDVHMALENLLFRELREGEYHFASYWSDRSSGAPSSIPTTQIVAGPPFNARLTLSVIF